MPKTLEKGTRVRVKTTMLGKKIGITPIPRRGGEGVIKSTVIGRRGKILYNVMMFKDGKQRPVLPKDLIVRRQPRKSPNRRKRL